jgi:hypothetical protein
MMAKGWHITRMALALGVLLWLTAGCTAERQVPANAPSVAPAPANSGSGSAGPRSRLSEPDASPQVSPQQPAPTISASPAATPVKPQTEPSPRAPQPAPSQSGKPDSPAAQPAPSSSQPATTPASPLPAVKEVTISVTGNTQWGEIVRSDRTVIKQNDSVADLLIRTLKSHKLSFEKRGSGAMFYVAGIDGLYEFDDGPTSGWKFRVNGKVSGEGAGSVELKPGDRVEWFYTSEDTEAKQGGDGQGGAP